MDILRELGDYLVDAAWPWLFAFSFMTALELLLPRGRKQGISARLAGLMFWSIWVPIGALIYGGYHLLWAWLGIPPLIVLPLGMGWSGVLAPLLAPLAGAFVYDFFFYWCHRAQHRWFWRFHAVHHSIEDLSAVNAYHHISEPLFQTALILLPMSLISSATITGASIMLTLIYLQAALIHSPTRFHLGVMRLAVADNSFHRIHHSLEERHFDKNFGAFTTLWDRLFGTAWMPASDEWPDTGLAEIGQPRTLHAWLTLPWRFGRDKTPQPAGQAPAHLAAQDI